MQPKLYQQAIVIGFLLMTFSGFVYTVSRAKLPIPWIFTNWSYHMMGPFQGYDRENYDMLIEVQAKDGTWRKIENETLLDLPRQKRTAVLTLKKFSDDPIDMRFEQYRELAMKLFDSLNRSEEITALKISLEYWPQSEEGIDVLRKPPLVRTQFITQVP